MKTPSSVSLRPPEESDMISKAPADVATAPVPWLVLQRLTICDAVVMFGIVEAFIFAENLDNLVQPKDPRRVLRERFETPLLQDPRSFLRHQARTNPLLQSGVPLLLGHANRRERP